MHIIKIAGANIFFENVAKLNYLETTVTDKNYINEEVKTRLNVVNAYLRRLVSKYLTIRNIKFKCDLLPVTWIKGCENKVPRRIFGERKLQQAGENCKIRSLKIRNRHKILLW
jgi:hypothetical protein